MTQFAPGLLFVSAENGTEKVDDLVGRTFHTIADGGSEIVAVCNDGLHGVSSEGVHQFTSTTMTNVSSGAGFFIAIDSSSSLYSWGPNGFHGQLGHGACHQHLSEPTKLEHSAKFVSVSSGDAFSLALDDRGGAYSWGENFDKQLGLYTKTVREMHLANAMVEDLSFVPRLIPLSLSHPVTKVSCGLKFALVITKGGVLYSWGAGECGQLGTGRCTQREVPAPVMLQDSRSGSTGPLIARDVACGAAHVVAVSEEGALYSWGLNKASQLGLDDTRTQHFPARVEVLLNSVPDPSAPGAATGLAPDPTTVVSDVDVAKVYCNGHSSAAVDRQGRLFTWGSTASHRLMHRLPLQKQLPPADKAISYSELRTLRMGCAKGNVGHFKASKAVALKEAAAAKAQLRSAITFVGRPTQVVTSHLKDCAVQSFAFASTHSAALVLSCLKKAWPSEGPRRSFSKLQLFGDGFWDAPNIVVKFTFKQAGLGAAVVGSPSPGPATPATGASRKSSRLPAEPAFNPPRSCSGKFVNTSTIQCRPPKFSEPGLYSVSISMDGTSFLQDTVDIFVHQELSVQKQLPELLDLSVAPNLDQLELHVVGLPTLPLDWQGSYHVRLLFSCLEGAAAHGSHLVGAAGSSAFAGISTKTSASSKEPRAEFQVDALARLQAPTTRPATPSAASQADTDNEDDQPDAAPPAAAVADLPAAVSVLVCHNIDLADFQARAGRALFEMRCQVSLNGQDFSSLKLAHTSHRQRSEGSVVTDNSGAGAGAHAGAEHPPSTLVYAFTAESVTPACLSIDRLNPYQQQEGADVAEVPHVDVVVKGKSFLPTSRLPKNAQVYARLVPLLPRIQWEAGFVSQLDASTDAALDRLPHAVFPVRCESTSSLTVGMDVEGLALLQEIVNLLNALGSGVDTAALGEVSDGAEVEGHQPEAVVQQHMDLFPLQMVFELHLSDQIIPLSSAGVGAQLLVNLYRNPPLQVVPNCCNAAVESDQWYSLLINRVVNAEDTAAGVSAPAGSICADGFRFHSPQVQVAVHVPRADVSEPLRADQFHSPIFLPSADVRFLPVPVPVATTARSVHGEDPEASAEETVVPATPLASTKFIVQVRLQALSHYVQQVAVHAQSGADDAPPSPPPFLCISCWLDGVSEPPADTWSKLQFYHHLAHNSAVNPPAPKTGFVPGNAVTLDLLAPCARPSVLHPDILAASALVESWAAAAATAGADENYAQQEGELAVQSGLHAHSAELQPVTQQRCVVRVRGAPSEELPHGAVLDIPAHLASAPTAGFQTTVTFDIPETVKSVHGMLPVQKTPKDKSMYFVDISMDGGATFDCAEVPLLFLK